MYIHIHIHIRIRSHKPSQKYNQEFLSVDLSNSYVLFKFFADPQWPRYNLQPRPADPLVLLLQIDPQEGQERRIAHCPHQKRRYQRQRLRHHRKLNLASFFSPNDFE